MNFFPHEFFFLTIFFWRHQLNQTLTSVSGTLVHYTIVLRKSPWVEYLTSLPNRGAGALLSVSTFKHDRVPMICSQLLDALEANNWTNNNIQQNHHWLLSRILTAPYTLNSTMSLWTWYILWSEPHYLCPSMQRCFVVASLHRVLISIYIALEAVLFKLHIKLAPE